MNAARRRLLLGAVAGATLNAAVAAPCDAWPAWVAFRQQFIGDGGRVVESATPRQRTVSEAQGYAMFFALVAGERALFERLLRWTEDNLAGGDLTQRLPAWLWGRRDDGSWGVIDDNAAADADLWIAYALGEAGRLWGVRRYTALSRSLSDRVAREETADLPGLGPTLLPGPKGFAGSDRWRLNPSYLPPMQLRWLAARGGGAWPALHSSSLRVLRDSAPQGIAPDWAVYEGGRFRIAEQTATDRDGSYDAIRVYLWLGLTSAHDPARAALLAHFAPMARATESAGAPPEHIDAIGGAVQGEGPPGFSAALLPFLQALGQTAAARAQLQRVQSQPPAADAYYGQALALFGLGAQGGRFHFDAEGCVQPAWTACAVPERSR